MKSYLLSSLLIVSTLYGCGDKNQGSGLNQNYLESNINFRLSPEERDAVHKILETHMSHELQLQLNGGKKLKINLQNLWDFSWYFIFLDASKSLEIDEIVEIKSASEGILFTRKIVQIMPQARLDYCFKSEYVGKLRLDKKYLDTNYSTPYIPFVGGTLSHEQALKKYNEFRDQATEKYCLSGEKLKTASGENLTCRAQPTIDLMIYGEGPNRYYASISQISCRMDY